MASRELDRPIQLSVLDRLLDDGEPASADGLTALRESVRRDLEWLLNTRRLYTPISEDYPELQRSVLLYGLPDITSLGRDASVPRARLHAHIRARLQAHIEESLALFEPRLRNVRVAVVEAPDEDGGLRPVHFRIQALLLTDPEPVRLWFDTMVDRTTGDFDVDIGGA